MQQVKPKCMDCKMEEEGLELTERITDSGTRWICKNCSDNSPKKMNLRGHIKEVKSPVVHGGRAVKFNGGIK